jgi:hypothetical protein
MATRLLVYAELFQGIVEERCFRPLFQDIMEKKANLNQLNFNYGKS